MPRPTRQTLVSLAPALGLVVASAIVRGVAGHRVPGLWLVPDETIYGTVGRNLWEHGRLSVLPGGATAIYSVAYPALIGLPLALFDGHVGYDVAKALQAVVMSAAAIPVYLWARTLVSHGRALIAAALTLAIPGLAYTGLLMTEVAFYPAVALAAWAAARALVTPDVRRQVLLVAAVVLAIGVRLQGAALVPALAVASLLFGALERDRRRALALWPAVAALVGVAVVWSAVRIAGDGPWTEVFGSYGDIAGGYDAAAAARWIAYHVGDLLLLTAAFPAFAVGVVAVRAARARDETAEARAYVAVTLAISAAFVVLVGLFASKHVERLVERDLIGLAPLLFIGFALWLERGAPRPPVTTAAVVLLLTAFVLALPVRELFANEALADTLTGVPLVWLAEHRSPETLEVAFYVGAGVAALAFALWPRRLAPALAIVGFAALASTAVAATRFVERQARQDQAALLGGEHDWIDRTAGRTAAYVYAGEANWAPVWQLVFWNDRLRRVITIGDPVPGPMPQERADVRPDGRVTVARPSPDYVVATANYRFVGTPTAAVTQTGLLYQPGMTLWRVAGTLRLDTVLTGVLANGDMSGPARLTVYACGSGILYLTLLQKGATRVEIRRNGEVVARPAFSGGVWSGEIETPPGADGTMACAFDVTSDGFLGSTQFEFVRR